MPNNLAFEASIVTFEIRKQERIIHI